MLWPMCLCTCVKEGIVAYREGKEERKMLLIKVQLKTNIILL